MAPPVLLIVIASTRPTRIGHHFARWFEKVAIDKGTFEVRVADLAEIELPVFDEPRHPRLGQYEHQHTKDWSAIVAPSDAVVFVTPEYNHSFPGGLKNAIDYLNAEWRDKAAGFVSYGGVSAGTRAVTALKPVVGGLRMIPVVDAVNIPFCQQFLTEDGSVNANETMLAAAGAMLDELLRITRKLRG